MSVPAKLTSLSPDGTMAVRRRALVDALATDDAAAQRLAGELRERFGDADELVIAPLPGAGEQAQRMNGLVELLMPDRIPQPVELLQARRSAQLRRDMLAELGYLTAEELADQHGSKAKNRYALAARWSRDARVFGVPLGGRTVFPAFQFDADGQPYPVIAAALEALPRAAMSPWAVGLWWYAANPALPGDARPADLVGTRDETEIVTAAQRLADPLPL